MSSSRRAAGNIHILARLDGVGKARPKRVLLWSGIAGALACALAGAVLWMARMPDPPSDATTVATVVPPDAAAPHVGASHAEAPATPVIASLTLPPTPPATPGGAMIVNVPDMATPPAPAIASHAAATPAHHPGSAQDVQPPRIAAGRAAPHPAGANGHGAPAPRRAPPAKSVPAPAPDTDVALISAIIQHAAAKHDDVDDAACGGKPCAERQPGPP